MTTHHVEIRLMELQGSDQPWTLLTKAPVEARVAAGLCAAIGPLWESRIAPVSPVHFASEIARLVQYAGDPNQIERHAAGVLPFAEVCALARRALFSPFESAVRAKRWQKAEIVHHPDCTRPTAEVWRVHPMEILTGDQWFAQRALLDDLEIIRELALEIGMVIAPRLLTPKAHNARCTKCGGLGMGTSIQVVIHWGDHVLTREYVL